MSTPLDKLFENIEYDESQCEERYAGVGDMENLKKAESKINASVLKGFIYPTWDGKFVLVEIDNNKRNDP